MNNTKCFDKICDKYYSVYGSNPEYTYFLEEFMRIVHRGKILDLGCGIGIPVGKYLLAKGYDVVGVDSSKKMISLAKQNIPKAQLIHEDISKLDLEERGYEGIVSFFTFNFMKKKDFEKAFSKIAAAVKEDGGILIGAIEGETEAEELLLGEKVQLHKFTEEYLKGLLKDFHLFIIEKREYHPEGLAAQNQIFIIGKKKTYAESTFVEASVKEAKADPEEPAEDKPKLIQPADLLKLEEPSKKKSKEKISEGAIRIKLFGKKKDED